MRMHLSSLVIFVTLVGAAPAFAQDPCPSFERNVANVASAQSAEDARRAALALVDVGQTPRCFVEFLGQYLTFTDLVLRFESSRSDRQAGTGSPTSGTTTVVAAGPTAKALSLAAESGAMTQSVTKSVVTVRGNLAGLPAALVGKGLAPYCIGQDGGRGCIDRGLLRGLRRVSFGVSFDPSRRETLTATPTTSPAVGGASVSFTGSRQEVAAYNVRVDIWNRRDATSPEFAARWTARLTAKNQTPASDATVQAVNTAASELAGSRFIEQVMELEGYDTWQSRSRDAIVAARPDRQRIVDAHTRAMRELADMTRSIPDWAEHVQAMRQSYSRFFLAQDNLIDTLASANVLAAEFTREQPVGQPSTANVRLIFDYPLSKETRVVANGAITFYDADTAATPGVDRLRDAQLGLQLNHDIGTLALLGPASVSIAGYYQYQRSPSILKVDAATPLPGVTFVGLPAGAKDVLTRTGDIMLAQARLALTPPGSSVTIPLSVTYSNRTELVDKPAWRGQVGISYNLDTLFAALR